MSFKSLKILSRKDANEYWRKLHKRNYIYSYRSPNKFRIIKSVSVRGAEYLAEWDNIDVFYRLAYRNDSFKNDYV